MVDREGIVNTTKMTILIYDPTIPMWKLKVVSIMGVAQMSREGFIMRDNVMNFDMPPTLGETNDALDMALRSYRPDGATYSHNLRNGLL